MCTWNNLLRVTMKGYCQSAAANEGNLHWTTHNYFWFYATTWPWETRQAAHRRQKICMVVKVNSGKGHAWTILLHDTEIQLMIWMLNLAHACAVALTLLLMLHAWSACHDKTPCSCKFGGNWSWQNGLQQIKKFSELKFGSWWLCIQILIFHHTFIFGSKHMIIGNACIQNIPG